MSKWQTSKPPNETLVEVQHKGEIRWSHAKECASRFGGSGEVPIPGRCDCGADGERCGRDIGDGFICVLWRGHEVGCCGQRPAAPTRSEPEPSPDPPFSVEQAIDDLRVAWSPDSVFGSFSLEECEARLDALIAAVRAESAQEIARLTQELILRRLQMAAFPFCSDHRDKVLHRECYACRIEKAEADLARLTRDDDA